MLTSLLSKARFLGWPIALVSSAAAIVLGAASFTFEGTPKPTVGEFLATNLVEAPTLETTEWLSSPKKGDYKGQVADIGGTFSLTTKELKELKLTWKDLRFFVRTCRYYSTTGDADNNQVPELASYCTNRTVTISAARKQYRKELAEAKQGTGVPALVG